jgi:hypothetical protein
MGAKAEKVWAALRALYEGEKRDFELLAEAGSLTEVRVRCRAERDGWVPGGLATSYENRTARLQKQIAQLEGEIADVIGSGASSVPGLAKARLDLLGLLLRSVEKLKEMMPAETIRNAEAVKEREKRVGSILRRIEERAQLLGRFYASKAAKAVHGG